jgi:hypothetical protein
MSWGGNVEYIGWHMMKNNDFQLKVAQLQNGVLLQPFKHLFVIKIGCIMDQFYSTLESWLMVLKLTKTLN